MGVVPFVLKGSARCTVVIDGVEVQVGIVERKPWKLTEQGDRRSLRSLSRQAEEYRAAEARSPRAVLVRDPISLKDLDGRTASGTLIGWEVGRTSVTDNGWDYLPQFGFVVPGFDGGLVLNELRGSHLVPVSIGRAVDIGLLDPQGRLLRRGQPTITECRSVNLLTLPQKVETGEGVRRITGIAEADCSFDDGQSRQILIEIETEEVPSADWMVGKTPRDAGYYEGPNSSVDDLTTPPPGM